MFDTKIQKININLIIIILYIFWFLILGYKNIFEPFVGDDLHLFREYSTQELINVCFSNWDPDNLETVSYRPLAIWYYHLQAVIFGENTGEKIKLLPKEKLIFVLFKFLANGINAINLFS